MGGGSLHREEEKEPIGSAKPLSMYDSRVTGIDFALKEFDIQGRHSTGRGQLS